MEPDNSCETIQDIWSSLRKRHDVIPGWNWVLPLDVLQDDGTPEQGDNPGRKTGPNLCKAEPIWNPWGHHAGFLLEEIASTSRDSDLVCSRCSGTGWRRANGEDFIGFRRCECVKEKIRAERLSATPELFKSSTFESYRPHNQRQERALSLM
jgi:hypothetical protein